MGVLAFIILGGICGWLAGFFVDKQGGIIRNIILGIVGSMLGGFVFEMFGGSGITGFNLYSILVGVVGSVILVSLISVVK